MKKIILVLLFFITLFVVFSQEPYKIYPVHDELKNKKFRNIYNELLKIADTKNSEKIIEYLANDHESLYECDKVNFKKCWNLDNKPDESFLWEVIKDTLNKGCRKTKNLFLCPYYYNSFPDGYDSHTSGLIYGKKVNVREKPSIDASIVGNYSNLVVNIDRSKKQIDEKINGEVHPWIAVVLPDKKSGYVYGKYIATPLDCRIIFSNENNEWKILSIACGD